MMFQPGLSVVNQLVARASITAEIPRRVIIGDSRDRRTCFVRYAVIRCAHECGLSSVQIGRGLNRDHTTILDGLRRAAELSASDPSFPKLVSAIALPIQEAA